MKIFVLAIAVLALAITVSAFTIPNVNGSNFTYSSCYGNYNTSYYTCTGLYARNAHPNQSCSNFNQTDCENPPGGSSLYDYWGCSWTQQSQTNSCSNFNVDAAMCVTTNGCSLNSLSPSCQSSPPYEIGINGTITGCSGIYYTSSGGGPYGCYGVTQSNCGTGEYSTCYWGNVIAFSCFPSYSCSSTQHYGTTTSQTCTGTYTTQGSYSGCSGEYCGVKTDTGLGTCSAGLFYQSCSTLTQTQCTSGTYSGCTPTYNTNTYTCTSSQCTANSPSTCVWKSSTSGACLPNTCTDSDGGLVYGTKGTVTSWDVNATDFCINQSSLKEYFCDSTNSGDYKTFDCSTLGDVCQNGACVAQDSITATTPSGVSSVTNGGTAPYSSTFTWVGNPATLILDHYDASGKSVKNISVSGSASPQTISNSGNPFTFSSIGINYVCAEGTAGTASIPVKSICEAVNVTSLPQDTITVNSPNGGENWTVGTNHAITWSSVGSISNVEIELTRNGGVNWSIITSSTSNGGSYTWNVTGPATSDAEIKIIDTADSAVYDTSNAPFTIYQSYIPPPACSLSSATASWGTNTAVPSGSNVTMTVSGASNCQGQTVLFDIYDSNNGHQSSTPPSATIGSNGVATSSWQTVYNSSSTNLYYFTGYVSLAGTVTSADPKLNVTNVAVGCSNIASCGDYTDSASCNNDICTVAKNTGDTSCLWDSSTSTCNGVTTYTSKCGDGIIEKGEQCDGTHFGSTITGCTNFGNFTGGTLTCNNATSSEPCQFNTSLCTGGTVGVCGNNKVNTGETCDGSSFGPINPVNGCTNFDSFTSGSLSCDSSCQINTTQCTGGSSNVTAVGECIHTQLPATNNCTTDSFLSLKWTNTWNWSASNPNHLDPNGLNASCLNGPTSRTVECPAQTALPFFGTYNLIAALIIIAVVYWILSKDKRHVRKVSK